MAKTRKKPAANSAPLQKRASDLGLWLCLAALLAVAVAAAAYVYWQ